MSKYQVLARKVSKEDIPDHDCVDDSVSRSAKGTTVDITIPRNVLKEAGAINIIATETTALKSTNDSNHGSFRHKTAPLNPLADHSFRSLLTDATDESHWIGQKKKDELTRDQKRIHKHLLNYSEAGMTAYAYSQDSEYEPPFNDALKYAKGSAIYAIKGRSPALMITYLIEMIPAFVVATGANRLDKWLSSHQANILVGFLTIISAISGNIGLQSSSLMTRALSHAFTNSSNLSRVFLKEITAAFVMGSGFGFLLGVTAFIWAKSIRVAIIVGIAQLISVVMAAITGTASPLIFHGIFGKDPGMWAGPLETAVQDIVGSSALFFGGIGLLHLLPSTWS